MKRKILSAVLLVATAVTLIACNRSSVDTGSDKVYEIVWYNRAAKTRDHDLVFDEISQYTLEKINAKITCIPIRTAEFSEKMKMLMAANEKFDMTFANDFAFNVSNSAYLELDELLEKEGKEIKSILPDYVWPACTVGGKIYGVPSLKDWAHEYVLWCNTSLAEKYDFDLSTIKEFKEIEPMLKTIKENEPDIYPTAFVGTNASLLRYTPFEHINGSVVGAFNFDNYDKIVNWVETEEAKEFFYLMRRWYQNGYLRKDANTVANSQDIIRANRVFLDYGANLPYYELQLNLGFDEDEKRTFIHFNEPSLFTNDVLGSVQAISRTSGNPSKTMEFMSLLFTDEYLLNMIVHGIEGKHYAKVGNKHFRYPDGISSSSDNDYAGSPAVQGNRYLLLTQEGTPSDIWEKYQEFNDIAIKSPSLGFMFDASNITSEVAAVQNAYQEFLPSLLTGAVDPDIYLPQALNKLKTAGVDVVLAEVQKQYDEWKTSK